MDFKVITEEEWEALIPHLSKAEATAVKTIEWAWERWYKGGLSSHQRRYLGDVLKCEAKKINTQEARRYLNRRYRERYRK